MPPLPFDLAKILANPIPNLESEKTYTVEGIHPDAPEDLKIMAQNVADILSSIRDTRCKDHGNQNGDMYAHYLTLFIALISQVNELEVIGCETSRQFLHVIKQLPEDKATDLQAPIESSHDLTHLYANAIQQNVYRLIEFLETSEVFAGITKDIDTVLERINKDWHQKGHKHG